MEKLSDQFISHAKASRVHGIFLLADLDAFAGSLSKNVLEFLIENDLCRQAVEDLYTLTKPVNGVPGRRVSSANTTDVVLYRSHLQGEIVTLHGMEDLYRLGFMSQMPVQPAYWTNGVGEVINVFGRSVKISSVPKEWLANHSEPEGKLLRALVILNREPTSVELVEALKRLRVSPEDYKQKLDWLCQQECLPSEVRRAIQTAQDEKLT